MGPLFLGFLANKFLIACLCWIARQELITTMRDLGSCITIGVGVIAD